MPPTTSTPAKPSQQTHNNQEEQYQNFQPNPSLITQDLRDLMRSEKALSLSDVTLITLEGTKVPAIRALLVIRSSFFEKLFTCDFVEKNSSTVKVSLPSVVLRRVLDFVYTDDCPLLREICFPTDRSRTVKCDSVLNVIRLAFAADYTRVEKLLHFCKQALKVVISENKHPLCIVLQELTDSNAIWGADLVTNALKELTKSPHLSLLQACHECGTRCGVRGLSADLVENILKHAASPTPEIKDSWLTSVHGFNGQKIVFLQVLIVWGTCGNVLLPNWSTSCLLEPYIFLDVHKIKWDSDLLPVAKRLAKLFNLAEFSPTALASVVETSGLFPDSATTTAYRYLALKLERLEKRSRYF